MSIPITGSTYACRDQLRALGARFNPETNRWEAPTTAIAQRAQSLVGLGIHTRRRPSRQEAIEALRGIYATLKRGDRAAALRQIATLGQNLTHP